MKIDLKPDLKLSALVTKEGPMYVSWCPALDVSSCGDTPGRARENLAEAVNLFIADCSARGTLDQVLRDCGFLAQPPSDAA